MANKGGKSSASGAGGKGKGKGTGRKQSGGSSTAAQRKSAAAAAAAAKSAAAAAAASATAKADVNLPKPVVPAAAPVAPAPAPEPIPPTIVKEYSEYMKFVDHAMNMEDWASTGLITGQKPQDVNFSEEQKHLLYGDGVTKGPDGKKKTPSPPKVPEREAFPRPGWSKRNVLSSRTAWSKVRLREREKLKAAGEDIAPPGTPVLELPTPGQTITATSWFNEDVAENDKTLALVSEATQSFLRGILEKAVHCARQRQNVDGIRLWHQQVTHKPSKASSNSDDDKNKKPTLSLRLGCDVRRQFAQAQGNAAMTAKRMEEALERQDVPVTSRTLNNETLPELSSIADAAGRPRLADAVDNAELNAKRSYEIYGGKEAGEPPLGRLAKRAKLEVTDFQAGMRLPTFRQRGAGSRFRASNTGGAFIF